MNRTNKTDGLRRDAVGHVLGQLGGHFNLKQAQLYLLIGSVLWGYMSLVFFEIAYAIGWERWEGTIEHTFMAPVRRATHLIGICTFAMLYGLPWLNEKFGIQLQFDLDSIKQLIADNLDSAQAVSLKVLTGPKAGGMMVVGILINLVLIPVVMFYLLRDWSRIVRRLDELTPRRWLAKVRTMALEIDNVLGEFLRGQLSVMGVLAIYYAVGLTLA